MKKWLLLLILLLVFPAPVFAEYVVNQQVEVFGSHPGTYTGQLVDGVPHGYGSYLIEADDKNHWVYTGEFEKGYFHGDGVIQKIGTSDFRSGRFERGVFVEGKCSAVGGYVFEGTFTDGNSGTGSGKVYDPEGALIFEGTFDHFCLMDGTLYNKKTGEPAITGHFGEGFFYFVQTYFIPGYIYY